jgi:DNA polymerase-3 subunit alpha
MRIIESYATDNATVVLGGRTYPVPSLIEDDEDGIRWMLSPSHNEVYAPTWARASAAGAAGIMVAGELKIRAIISERFAEDREERRPNYVVPAGSWSLFDHVPTYTEVFSAPRGALILPASFRKTTVVHGHAHSEYSPLDGESRISEMVAEAVADGQPGLALTDHGRCSGHPELQAECDKAGIKPVFGIEAYFVNDRIIRAEAGDSELAQKLKNDYWHLILWAMNEEGLHNLWAMSTESFRDGFYYRPRMDWNTLRRHSGGILAASGCLRGPLSVPILNDDEDLARQNLGKLLDIFGDRFYLEIQPNALAEQQKVNRALVTMAKDFGVPLMATVDSHYPTRQDHDAHEAWIAIQTNSDINDEGDLFSVNLELPGRVHGPLRVRVRPAEAQGVLRLLPPGRRLRGLGQGRGILVGPGRGSGGGSLVAYLCGSPSLDPVEATSPSSGS